MDMTEYLNNQMEESHVLDQVNDKRKLLNTI